MGKLNSSRRPSRVPQIGDMRDRISLCTRSIQAPKYGSANFSQNYVVLATIWSSVETITYKAPNIFDSINVVQKDSDVKQRLPTIIFKIRYRSDITTETIIQFSDNYYEILYDPNLDKRSRFMFLRCDIVGDTSKEVSK